jgi:hypothetical protein
MLPAHVVSRLSLTLAVLAGLATAAQGGFVVISQPNAAYLASTTKFSIPTSGPAVSSLAAGDLTITFSGPMSPAKVGPGHFGWANPPFVEDSAPAALFSQGQSSRVLTFSEPLKTFGVEMQSNNPTNPFLHPTFTLTAQFFNGNTLLDTISQHLHAPGGARLFAATDTDIPFTSVKLSAASAAGGFVIADVRAEVATPEPASLGLFGLGLLGVFGTGWRRRAGSRASHR